MESTPIRINPQKFWKVGITLPVWRTRQIEIYASLPRHTNFKARAEPGDIEITQAAAEGGPAGLCRKSECFPKNISMKRSEPMESISSRKAQKTTIRAMSHAMTAQ